jgi:hypothetical protein
LRRPDLASMFLRRVLHAFETSGLTAIAQIQNFNLMFIAVFIRLVLLAVNGITVAVFFQIFFYADNKSTIPATATAFVLLVRSRLTSSGCDERMQIMFCLGLPIFNIMVVHRLVMDNSFISQTTKDK